jgi:hypothetical protein
MYLSDDPRSNLQPSAGAAATARASATPGTRFAAAEYAQFDGTSLQESSPQAQTWYSRGQNFVVSFTRATAGALLERAHQADEYMLLVPERDMPVTVQAADVVQQVSGYVLAIVPPGRSVITARGPATLIRIFSAASPDLNAMASNASAYAHQHPHIPPFREWPAPPDGSRLRIYDLDVPPVPGRFGRIWRCSTLMVNVHPLEPGPRDLARLSPHHHEDFEQGSLALKGSFTHHIRWPWTPDIKDWRDDDHVACPAPSLAVIPPPAIHTSAGTDPVLNHLVDIFSPPRMDFSKMDGWVLNANEYPMPAESLAK